MQALVAILIVLLGVSALAFEATEYTAQSQRDPLVTQSSLIADSWSRNDCMGVALTWFNATILYNWKPMVQQYVSNAGNFKGLYRADCSGFGSAVWNYPPPGYTSSTFPGTQLASCDAIVNRGKHVAIFVRKEGDKYVFIEECGHNCCGAQNSCCGGGSACPGRCGTQQNCNNYCDGCPVMYIKRDLKGLAGYIPLTRPNWS